MSKLNTSFYKFKTLIDDGDLTDQQVSSLLVALLNKETLTSQAKALNMSRDCYMSWRISKPQINDFLKVYKPLQIELLEDKIQELVEKREQDILEDSFGSPIINTAALKRDSQLISYYRDTIKSLRSENVYDETVVIRYEPLE
jgi:hypothetical protein